MPVPPDHHRRRSDPLVRRRTVVAGAVLGTALLLVLGVLGGTTVPPAGPTPEESDRPAGSSGPLVAVQPQPPSPPGPPAATPAAPPVAPVTPASPPSPPPAPSPEQGRLVALCRTLFENPADLPELLGALVRRPAPEPAGPDPNDPGRTGVDGLRKVLHVLDPEQAESAYQRLRDSIARCGRFAAALPDGTPVTVRLRQVTTPERGQVDEAYTAEFTAETPAGTRTGWLAVDRLGPMVSVLYALAPEGRDPARWSAERESLRRAVWRELVALLPVLG